MNRPHPGDRIAVATRTGPRTPRGLTSPKSPHLRNSSVSTVACLSNPQPAMACAVPEPGAQDAPAPTPIGCKLLKIRPVRRSRPHVFRQGQAKRRDYAANSGIGQHRLGRLRYRPGPSGPVSGDRGGLYPLGTALHSSGPAPPRGRSAAKCGPARQDGNGAGTAVGLR